MLYVCVRDVMDVFCLYCDACSCRCLCMGIMSVSSLCCVFVSCVHPVTVLNDELWMTCSLLMHVKGARGDHMEEAYPRVGLMTDDTCVLLHGKHQDDLIIRINKEFDLLFTCL